MTTILGINGIDYKKKEKYVLLATDTQGSTKKTKISGHPEKIYYNIQKIMLHPKGNFTIAHTGTALMTSYKISEKVETIKYLIQKRKNFEKSELENLLIELNSELIKVEGRPNIFLISLRQNNELQLYYLKKQKKFQDISIALAGSGSEKIKTRNLERLSIHPFRLISKKEAFKEAFKTIQQAATQDTYTGGNFTYSYLTKKGLQYDLIGYPLENSVEQFLKRYKTEEYIRKILSEKEIKEKDILPLLNNESFSLLESNPLLLKTLKEKVENQISLTI